MAISNVIVTADSLAAAAPRITVPAREGARLFQRLASHRADSQLIPRSFQPGPPQWMAVRRIFFFDDTLHPRTNRFSGVHIDIPVLPETARFNESEGTELIDNLITLMSAVRIAGFPHLTSSNLESLRAVLASVWIRKTAARARGARPDHCMIAQLGGGLGDASAIISNSIYPHDSVYHIFMNQPISVKQPTNLLGEFVAVNPFARDAPVLDALGQSTGNHRTWTSTPHVAGLSDQKLQSAGLIVAMGATTQGFGSAALSQGDIDSAINRWRQSNLNDPYTHVPEVAQTYEHFCLISTVQPRAKSVNFLQAKIPSFSYRCGFRSYLGLAPILFANQR